MEASVGSKLDIMRQDIASAQASMVSKGELDTHLRTINRDTERIEKQLREELKQTRVQLDEKLREYRQESRDDLAEFKADINTSLTRLIILLGVGISVVQVIIALMT